MKGNWQKAEKVLKDGGIAVIPTDTLYGLCASVFNKKAVEKIYRIKKRNTSKPFIVLISSVKQLKDFGINGDFSKIFKPKVSVLLKCKGNNLKHIHRGTNEIAFRMIGKKHRGLYDLITKIGPIVAPSANYESDNPAKTIKEARKYFSNNVDCYVDGGEKIGKPSTLVRVSKEGVEILRK
jgi:L-threonylcarbamoyladenylate synthase